MSVTSSLFQVVTVTWSVQWQWIKVTPTRSTLKDICIQTNTSTQRNLQITASTLFFLQTHMQRSLHIPSSVPACDWLLPGCCQTSRVMSLMLLPCIPSDQLSLPPDRSSRSTGQTLCSVIPPFPPLFVFLQWHGEWTGVWVCTSLYTLSWSLTCTCLSMGLSSYIPPPWPPADWQTDRQSTPVLKVAWWTLNSKMKIILLIFLKNKWFLFRSTCPVSSWLLMGGGGIKVWLFVEFSLINPCLACGSGPDWAAINTSWESKWSAKANG